MKSILRHLVLTALLLAAPALGGCATIIGTAVSPFTGGVDLVREAQLEKHQWPWIPFVFLGGAVAGPFVAIYNGVQHDASIFQGFRLYWLRFDEIFRPFRMINS